MRIPDFFQNVDNFRVVHAPCEICVDNFLLSLWISFHFKGFHAPKPKKQPFLVDNFSFFKIFQ